MKLKVEIIQTYIQCSEMSYLDFDMQTYIDIRRWYT